MKIKDIALLSGRLDDMVRKVCANQKSQVNMTSHMREQARLKKISKHYCNSAKSLPKLALIKLIRISNLTVHIFCVLRQIGYVEKNKQTKKKER